MILESHIVRQRAWSTERFGKGRKTAEIIAHIRKELDEIAARPDDLEEWVDVILLALDGAWRTGARSAKITEAIKAKQALNESRRWPDKSSLVEGEPIEHIR